MKILVDSFLNDSDDPKMAVCFVESPDGEDWWLGKDTFVHGVSAGFRQEMNCSKTIQKSE